MERLEILKTYKIFIGGKFPRTESGRTFLFKNKNGKPIANVCQCSRKDFREAVVAARGAFSGWSQRAAFNRGQILYRIAEMLEGRKTQFIEELTCCGHTINEAESEVAETIEFIVYYSGWCDKYQQISGSVNPVATSHFNFTVPEPMGVVSLICKGKAPLLNFVQQLIPVIAGGNTAIILAPEKNPLCAVTFSEVLHSSDVPAGVVNVLTGSFDELSEQMASHFDVNAIGVLNLSNDQLKVLELAAVDNLKRVVRMNAQQSPYSIFDFQELKTTWHPIENIGGSGGGY